MVDLILELRIDFKLAQFCHTLKLITLGYFQDYDDIERSPSQLALEGNTEVHPGDLKYKDINGDGVIDRADFIRTGYPLVPEIQYGINLSLSYKGFDVGVLFQGSACGNCRSRPLRCRSWQ